MNSRIREEPCTRDQAYFQMKPTATARSEKEGRSGGNKRQRSGNARETALVNEPEGIRPGLIQLTHLVIVLRR